VDAGKWFRCQVGAVVWQLLLLLAVASCSCELFAQSAGAGVTGPTPEQQSAATPVNPPDASPQVAPAPTPAEASPGSEANRGANHQVATPAATPGVNSAGRADSADSGGSGVLPPAMATKDKIPAESDYNEVHIKPLVKSEDLEKLDPNSPATAESQVDPALRTHTKPVRVDVDLVLIPVTITDWNNRLVTGLQKEDFILIDNGERQEIQNFSSEDAPLSLGVIFDMSGSMANKIGKAREAVLEFFKTANPEDEFFLIGFSDKPKLITDFTSSVEQVQSQLVYLVPKGRTALLDAIYLGIAKMRRAKQQKKALLIISDGGDNHSRYTEREIKSQVREADVQIYAIGLSDSNPRSPEEIYGPELLADMTELTGGRTYMIDNPNELPKVAARIGIELRNQYVLGYRPAKPAHDGKWRKVKVKLQPIKGRSQLSVYAKTGYYAPSE
jgi:Ca-activated chloride channel family protein